MIRPHRISGRYAFIQLTRGLEAKIDIDDLPTVAGVNWCAQKCRDRFYAVRNVKRDGRWTQIKMHQLITGAAAGLVADHIDRDGLNNSRENLRLATEGENRRNQKIPAHNTSGLKGVTLNKQTGKWRAHIMLAKRQTYLGAFDTPDEAHAAYVAAAKDLHGEFARTN